MELDELLSAMDRTAANLAKLDKVWDRAAQFMPRPARGSSPEYDDLCRTWRDLLGGLPPIDGWTITDDLPDVDKLGRAYIEFMEIGEVPVVTAAVAACSRAKTSPGTASGSTGPGVGPPESGSSN